jgi:Subtilase family
MSTIDAEEPRPVDQPTRQAHHVRLSPQARSPQDALYYRDDVLLLPTELLGRVGELNELLASAGMAGPLEPAAQPAEHLGFTPRRCRLRLPYKNDKNAEEILQALRKHVHLGQGAGGPDDRAALVAELSLDPVAFPSIPLFGDPASKGHGYPGRTPVAVLASPPARRPVAELGCGRRPVVAVLDTGVLAHPWFGPIGSTADADAFVVEPEDWINYSASELPGPKTLPPPDLEPLHSHAGHGTFITGLIRQIAPDSRVLSMRVMHAEDGAVGGNLLLDALDYLCLRAESGVPDRFVDVVSLSLGYREQSPEDPAYTDQLRAALGRLGSLGVQVVASAGNRGEKVKTYPAALAEETPLPRRRVHSVGASNPNGTRARYSNHGEWVTEWQVATGVVSSFPPFDGGELPKPDRQPAAELPAGTEGLDTDDFTGGYATWSGTSFAAAAFAARLAAALVPAPGQAGPDATLLDVGAEAANARAERAYAACHGR